MLTFFNSQELFYATLGLASFGPVCLDPKSKNYGSITSTPKLAWQHTPILGPLVDGLKNKASRFKAVIDTDVNAPALLEAGGLDNVAYVTIGTGVGVGVVVNGKSVRGLQHPEGGHIRVERHPKDVDFSGACTIHGTCLEGLINIGSIMKRLSLKSN